MLQSSIASFAHPTTRNPIPASTKGTHPQKEAYKQ
jgi:hypothetical protein